jgi:hypothetical protein
MSSDDEVDEIEEVEETWISVADDLFKSLRKRKRLDVRCKKLSKELQGLSDDRTTKRGRYEYRLIPRKGAIEYSRIPELKDVDLEPYRKEEVKTWKLEVIE